MRYRHLTGRRGGLFQRAGMKHFRAHRPSLRLQDGTERSVSMDETRYCARWLLMLPALIIIGGVVVMVCRRSGTRRGRPKLRHQERMAMIERGMTPPESRARRAAMRRAHGFKMSLGILLCGLGLALFMLITLHGRRTRHRHRRRRRVRDGRARLHRQRMFTERDRAAAGAAAAPAWRERAEAAPPVKPARLDPPVPPSASDRRAARHRRDQRT